MDPLATNAETLNDEWRAYDLAKAKELARPLGTFEDELALQKEQENDTVLPYRSQRWYRAIIRELERRKVAQEKEWAEEDAEREKERAEAAVERAREAAEERILERARTHALKDAAATIVFAHVLQLCWQFFWLWWLVVLGHLGVFSWTPSLQNLVFYAWVVLDLLGYRISFGLTHAMVKKRFDPIAAWILTVVAVIAANETTVAMLPAEFHDVRRLSALLYIDVDITTRALGLDIFLA